MNRIRLIVSMLAPALMMAACQGDPSSSITQADQTAESLLKPGEAIPGAYIVRLKEVSSTSNVPDVASDVAKKHTADVEHIYSHTIRGFSAHMSASAAEKLAKDDRVLSVEPDRVITLAPGKGRPGGGGGGSTPPPSQVTPWGITAVGGSGTAGDAKIWIIDTGIDLDNPDLNVDLVNARNYARGKDAGDGNGHGTHVAGIAAAKNNTIGVVGVAAGATVVPVRVLDNNGSGRYSDVIAGVDYVASKAQAGDVANMSLGGPISTTLDAAVIDLANIGVSVVIAAGNDGVDASTESPGHLGNDHPNIYTISAHDINGCLTYWSNYGADVEFAAPGDGILSLWKDGSTMTLSGTSMAAPHVAGLLAINALNSVGTACSDPDGTPDPLAHR